MSSYFDRTFGYRRLYVEAIVARAPRRATLAVASEVARLSFVVVGCGLFALIGWTLAAGAAGRGAWGWELLSGAGALAVTFLGIRAALAAISAARDMRRIRETVAGLPAGGSGPG
jgi:hypothetical protein